MPATRSEYMTWTPEYLNEFIQKEIEAPKNLDWANNLSAALQLINPAFGSFTAWKETYPNGSTKWLVRMYNQERFQGWSHGDTDDDLAYAICHSFYKSRQPSPGHRDWVDQHAKKYERQ